MNKNPFRYFKTSPEIIQLAGMINVRFPISLRNVEAPLNEREMKLSKENRILFSYLAAEISRAVFQRSLRH